MKGLIDAVINPTASEGLVKRKRSKSLVFNALQLLQPTDAELQAENARLLFENQEFQRELESVKKDFHARGLVN